MGTDRICDGSNLHVFHLFILKTAVRYIFKKSTFIYQQGFVLFENIQQGVSNL